MELEYPPLLPPGFTDVTLDELDRLFVEPFAESSARRILVSRLRALVSLLQEIGLECDIWINGSFATQKPDPGDIDVVIFSDDPSLNRLTVSQRERFRKIISKKDSTRYRFDCDVSYCDRGNDGQRSYWRGWFGFTEQENVKGIARLRLVAP